jgi:4-hydroxybenzoate polyprenyltransferase
MVDRDDDLRIGMKTSAITLGRWDVPAVMAFYGVYLLVWSAVVAPLLVSGWWWAGVAVASAQVVWHFQLIRHRSRDGCFKAFRLNHWVGLAVFAGIFAGLH